MPTSNGRSAILACGVIMLLSISPASAAETVFADDVRVQSDFTPNFVLDQIAGGGAAAQTWKVGLNTAGEFDIYDASNQLLPIRIAPGAPNYSLRIDGNGHVGFGTIQPAAHLHVKSLDIGPTLRLESINAIFPRAWDLRGSIAGFELLDVDNNNATPFAVLSGAPTNSFLMDATGRIGLGTATPDANSRLDIRSSLTNGLLMKRADANAHFLRVENSTAAFRCGVQGNGDTQFGALSAGKGLNLIAGGTSKLLMNSTGQISFGNTPPAITSHALIHQSGATLTLGGTWTNASSRALKQDIEPITSEQARDTVRALQPVGYRYKNELDERYVGFIAEDVPELVATNDRKGLASMDIVGVLTKVVQDQDKLNDQQQKTIDQQQQTIAMQQTLLVELTRRLTDLEQRTAGRGDSTP